MSGQKPGFVEQEKDVPYRTTAKFERGQVENAVPSRQAVSEETTDGILVVDCAGEIVRYNQRFLALWRIPAEFAERSDNARLISFVLDQLVDPGTFLRVTRENQVDPGREYFCTLRFKDGRVIERFSRPHRRGEEIVGRILRFRDVTEQERLAKEMPQTFVGVDEAHNAKSGGDDSLVVSNPVEGVTADGQQRPTRK